MSPKLSFYFKTTDPEFTVQTQTISSKPGNLVQLIFLNLHFSIFFLYIFNVFQLLKYL